MNSFVETIKMGNYIEKMINKYDMNITGIIHIGAHLCEELPLYLSANIKNIFWVEAQKKLVEYNIKTHGNINIGNYCISDIDDEEVEFNITNNVQSSSFLQLGTHLQHYPDVLYIDKFKIKTTTLKTLYHIEKLESNFANYLHLDIQGAELKALIGAGDLLDNFDYIYTEVNREYIYQNCCLISDIDDYLRLYNFERVFADFTPGPFKTDNNGNLTREEDAFGDALYIKKRKFNYL
jgi:FkbM family methyltransferase